MPSFSNCFVLVTALLILGFDNLCVAKVPGPFSFVHCSFVLFFCAVCYTVEDGNFSAELIWRRRLKDSFDLQFKLSQWGSCCKNARISIAFPTKEKRGRGRGGGAVSLHTNQEAHQVGAYPGLCSMKQLGIFLLPPGWDTSPSQGYLGLEPGPLDPESSALTMRSPRRQERKWWGGEGGGVRILPKCLKEGFAVCFFKVLINSEKCDLPHPFLKTWPTFWHFQSANILIQVSSPFLFSNHPWISIGKHLRRANLTALISNISSSFSLTEHLNLDKTAQIKFYLKIYTLVHITSTAKIYTIKDFHPVLPLVCVAT